jgi:hypothetical protein
VFISRINRAALVGVLAFVCASGCAARTTRNLGAAVALRGQAVADAALESYQALEGQQAVDKRQQDFIKIVTNPNLNATTIPDTAPPDFSLQLAPRVRAYRAWREAYVVFHQLSDTAFGETARKAADALTASLSGLKAIGDLPTGIGSLIGKLSEEVTETFRAGEVRRHNRVLLRMCETFRALWDADLPIWREYLRRIYKDYSDPLASVPPDRFDARDVGQIVKEPLILPLRVQLYKLQLRETARRRTDEIDARLHDVARALRLLESAHAELAKDRPSPQDVIELVETIRSLTPPAR